MRERLNAADYRFIAICLVLLGATVWFSAGNFYRAFPEASIDFKVNRDEAQLLAAKFLAGQQYQVDGYRQAAQFAYDEEAKTFLEREAGLEQLAITDSIPLPPEKQLPNIKIISVAALLANAVRRIHEDQSISDLFRDETPAERR